MRIIKYLAFLSLLLLPACSSLILKPADFAWPVETVLKVDSTGNVNIQRYSISFNTQELFLEETKDSSAYKNEQLRVIRNTNGYYFMTAENFKNVYVFKVNKGDFSLENKIEISDSTKMQNPAFNQRPPYIQLVYDNNKKVNLTENGIVKEEAKKWKE